MKSYLEWRCNSYDFLTCTFQLLKEVEELEKCLSEVLPEPMWAKASEKCFKFFQSRYGQKLPACIFMVKMSQE